MALKTLVIDTSLNRQKIVSVAIGNWFQEVPTGTVDGSNAAFVLANTPYSAGSTLVFLDGDIQPTTVYTLNIGTKTITFSTPPALGQGVYVMYLA